MENLGYGTHFTVDGFQAGSDELGSEGAALAFVRSVAGDLERDNVSPFQIVVTEDDGESAALVSNESQLLLHVFPQLRSLSLQVFTRREVSLSSLMTLLKQEFSAGRFESHLGNVARTAPTSERELQRLVQGDRAYARARHVNSRAD
jgi:hypothetical protein